MPVMGGVFPLVWGDEAGDIGLLWPPESLDPASINGCGPGFESQLGDAPERRAGSEWTSMTLISCRIRLRPWHRRGSGWVIDGGVGGRDFAVEGSGDGGALTWCGPHFEGTAEGV